MSRWTDHMQAWKSCNRCHLCSGRTNVVLARGSIPCDVLFIGEAPGESEDVIGKPFIGPAGKLLDHIINKAIGGVVLPQTDENGNDIPIRTAFTNLVACIPREEDGQKATEPDAEAIKHCAPRLKELVQMCRPSLIVRVGKLSQKYVAGQAQFSDYQNHRASNFGELPWIPKDKFLLFCDITHPAAILRANVAQQELMAQRCIVDLAEAVSEAFNI